MTASKFSHALFPKKNSGLQSVNLNQQLRGQLHKIDLLEFSYAVYSEHQGFRFLDYLDPISCDSPEIGYKVVLVQSRLSSIIQA